MTFDDAELENLGGSSREYTLHRNDELSKMKGWIRGNTKTCPAWEVAVCYHQRRYGIDIMINSLFGDGTRSWVMMVNGINKFVTEMSDETQENRTDDIGDSTWRFFAKARPKQTPRPTSSSPTITLPYHQRKWIDAEPGKFDKSVFEVSQQMTKLLLHSSYSTSEKKTGQSNSEPWQRCFIQNLRLLRNGQSEHG